MIIYFSPKLVHGYVVLHTIFLIMGRRSTGEPTSRADDVNAQLRALEAQFYEQFDVPGSLREVENQDRNPRKRHEKRSDNNNDSDDDRQNSLSLNDSAESTMEDQISEDEEDNHDEMKEDDDEFDDDENLLESAQSTESSASALQTSMRRVPETVVFTDPSAHASYTQPTKTVRKQFMVCACLLLLLFFLFIFLLPSDTDLRYSHRKLRISTKIPPYEPHLRTRAIVMLTMITTNNRLRMIGNSLNCYQRHCSPLAPSMHLTRNAS